jgi:hypothetical protein
MRIAIATATRKTITVAKVLFIFYYELIARLFKLFSLVFLHEVSWVYEDE